MDRIITIQRSTSTLDSHGASTDVWADLHTVRAQLVKASTEEFIRAGGASDETVAIFRTWWIDGITDADRVVYNGIVHNLKEVKELGRRNGLELRTHSFGAAA